jgi:hypothetical protein
VSDLEQLKAKLTRLAKEDKSGDPSGAEPIARLTQVFETIEETVLPRDITFRGQSDAQLRLTARNGRLIRFHSASATDTNTGLLGSELDQTNADQMEQLAIAMIGFVKHSGPMSISSEQAKTGVHLEDVGIAVDLFKRSLGLNAKAEAADPLKQVSRHIDENGWTWVRYSDATKQTSAGDPSAVTRLTEVFETALPCLAPSARATD